MPLNWAEWLCASALGRGVVPRHVAFIMDGNRRFAKQRGLLRADGHRTGFTAMNKIVEFCLQLGVQFVTAYAFSLENYNRTDAEVGELMELIVEKFADKQWIDEFVTRNRVKMVIVGDKAYCSAKIRAIIDALEDQTSKYEPSMVLQVAFCYSADHDFANSISRVSTLPDADLAVLENESSDLVSRKMAYQGCLATSSSGPPDLLIRTSGETRLSNFLVWEVSEKTMFLFLPKLWPTITPWDMVRCILRYQFSQTLVNGTDGGSMN